MLGWDYILFASCLALTAAPASEEPDPERTGASSPSRSGPWIRRWAPERGVVELGGALGVYLPGKNHELFEASLVLPEQGFRRFAPVAPMIAGRSGYAFLRFLVIEGELNVMPTTTDDDHQATLYTVRAGALGQLPWWSVTPFVVAGGGLLGVASKRGGVGNDIDPMMYLGGGLKVHLARHWQLRVDARDVISHKRGLEATFRNHNLETLLSLVVTLGRSEGEEPKEGPADTDKDGFEDVRDRCPNEIGIAPDGCPVRDADGDGWVDARDACVDEAGEAPDGCPPPDPDGDGDGVSLPEDLCPDVAGIAPDGCPAVDTDGDGVYDSVDRCADEPEVRNGYQDRDGCPDEVPAALIDLMGPLVDVSFSRGSSELDASSQTALDGLAEALIRYPSVRVEVVSHTDTRGDPSDSLALSLARARVIADYLSSRGLPKKRIEARGAGGGEPIASNESASGRAENTRVELRILDE